ncbi:MAG: hypothetical protein H6R16_92 [Proteobacteria bacterium]|nr:hypothetical protein [Pseudomonadota bacterium]
MKPEDWLHKALGINPPWQISHLIENLSTSRLDVWVSLERPKSGWFFSQRPSAPEHTLPVWRHLNIGNFKCHIHANPVEAGRHNNLGWIGDDGQPFTRAMVQLIGAHFLAGLSIQAVCPLLDIPAADVWKLKHNLDNGRTSLNAPAPLGDSPAVDHIIPEASHAIWQQLLSGEFNLDIRVLSLKLLMTKLREQVLRIQDSEVHTLKAHELQRYFVRHAHLLAHELEQINRI